MNYKLLLKSKSGTPWREFLIQLKEQKQFTRNNKGKLTTHTHAKMDHVYK